MVIYAWCGLLYIYKWHNSGPPPVFFHKGVAVIGILVKNVHSTPCVASQLRKVLIMGMRNFVAPNVAAGIILPPQPGPSVVDSNWRLLIVLADI